MLEKKEFNGFQLKLFALILMLLDHIHYIFEYTNKIPIWFSWLGRLAGGIFLFTMIEGYIHTSNKKKYFLRIYILSVLMSFIKYAIQFIPMLQRPDGFVIENGILQTFTILIVLFRGIDLIKDNKKFKGVFIFIAPFLLSYILMIPLQILDIDIKIKNVIFVIYTSIIPSPFISEGGIFVIICGLILYLFKENRFKQCAFYFIFVLLWMTILPIKFIEGITFKSMFTDYYEWMSAFAAIFMYKYNGKKGRSMKYLFYIFYPLHIYILYMLSIILYK